MISSNSINIFGQINYCSRIDKISTKFDANSHELDILPQTLWTYGFLSDLGVVSLYS